MQKPVALVASIFVVTVLVGFAVGFAMNQKDHVKQSNCPQGETCVRLLGKTADPDVITITPRTIVRFNSADGGRHSIALEHAAVQHFDDEEYHSGVFQKDEAWRVQFKKDGTYTFRDELNPDVKINVIVHTAGKVYKVE